MEAGHFVLLLERGLHVCALSVILPPNHLTLHAVTVQCRSWPRIHVVAMYILPPSTPHRIPTMLFSIPTPSASESAASSALIRAFALAPHVEGGYFRRTYAHATSTPVSVSAIHYLLTPHSPVGHFHRTGSVIVHSLHRGRGRCVLLHEDGRTESFVLGHAVAKGERCMWVVEGGVWRATMLEEEEEEEGGGLLITEVVVPGFDFRDHEFLGVSRLVELVGEDAAARLGRLCIPVE